MIKQGLYFISAFMILGGLILVCLCDMPSGNIAEILQVFVGFMGVSGVVYTLDLQRKTLKSQEEEFNRQVLLYSKQDIRDKFFKMIDYHNEILSQISVTKEKTSFLGLKKSREIKTARQAFVEYKIQIRELYCAVSEMDSIFNDLFKNEKYSVYKKEALMGLVYTIFHYGLSEDWKDALVNELDYYKKLAEERFQKHINGHKKEFFFELFSKNMEDIVDQLLKNEKIKQIGRTNQTYLSAYFKNMYNAIKLVDSDDVLNGGIKSQEKRKKRDKKRPKTEKENLITMLRAQLSYPEIYVLFFSLFAKFGQTWDDQNYIEGYEFIKNISKVDLDLIGIDPQDYFPNINYENYPS